MYMYLCRWFVLYGGVGEIFGRAMSHMLLISQRDPSKPREMKKKGKRKFIDNTKVEDFPYDTPFFLLIH